MNDTGYIGSLFALQQVSLRVRSRMALAAVFVLALLARLGAILVVRNYHSPQMWEWNDLTRYLVAGEGYRMFTVHGVGVVSAYMPPAYGYILAGVFSILGRDPVAFLLVQVVQAILSALLVLVIYRLARLHFDAKTAFLAAAVVALYPPFIYMSTEIHPISFYILLNAVMFLLLEEEAVTGIAPLWKTITAGLTLGVVLLFRAESLALVPILGLFVLLRFPQNRWRHALALVVCSMLIISPWIVRNFRTFHKLIPTTTTLGLNLWYGHNPLATGTQREPWPSGRVVAPPPDLQARFDALPATNSYELERDKIFLTTALQFMREHPKREVVLTLKKVLYFWTIDFNHPKARKFLYWSPTAVFLLLFWIGMVRARRGLLTDFLLFSIYFSTCTLFAMVFFVLPRYRMFIEPLMAVFVADGLIYLWGLLSGGRAQSHAR